MAASTWSRRSLLTALGSAALVPRIARGAVNGPAKKLVIVYAHGGWDPALVLDPKPDVPEVVTAPGRVTDFAGLRIQVPYGTTAVDAFFSEHAAEVAVVRGVDSLSSAHEICRRNLLTGTRDAFHPDVAAIVAAEAGGVLPLPYLVMSGRAIPAHLAGSAGWVGRSNQLGRLLDDNGGQASSSRNVEETVDAWLKGRHERLPEELSAMGRQRAADYGASIDRLAALDEKKEVFNTTGGVTTLLQQTRMAADAIAQGVSQSVMIDTGLNWDTHFNDGLQLGHHEQLFTGLTDLVGRLKEQQVFDDTVIWVCSEMGRTPALNATGGKEHHRFTSAMLLGGGVRGGTYGGTNDQLAGLPMSLESGQLLDSGVDLRAGDMAAGILQACGVDSTAWLPYASPFRAPFPF